MTNRERFSDTTSSVSVGRCAMSTVDPFRERPPYDAQKGAVGLEGEWCPGCGARRGRARHGTAGAERRRLHPGRRAQTRRRLAGRVPLCGWGVTSWIEPTSRPVAGSERIAVSRPEPGPLTKTSTFFRPCSCAWRAAASAAICAAYGVDLREPLKPTWPAEAQEMTAPVGSVMDTIVLLNVLLMWAWPLTMFFLSLRRGLRAAA